MQLFQIVCDRSESRANWKSPPAGEKTEQQVEEPNLANPSDGLQVRAKTKYVVQYAAGGTNQTKTIEVRDSNGNFGTVAVEALKSDRPVQAPAPEKPADNPQKKP
jgi:hypothetical protein